MRISNVIVFQRNGIIFYHKSNIFSNIIYSFLLGTTIEIQRIYVLIENEMAPKQVHEFASTHIKVMNNE